jgi:hypothetical protein
MGQLPIHFYSSTVRFSQLSIWCFMLIYILDEAVLSRMITTIDDRANGFRHILIPMTMSEANPTSATALSHTILALSAYHCSGPRRALEHKVKALNHLSRSWSEDSYAARLTQMAACMMLCVYEVGRISIALNIF